MQIIFNKYKWILAAWIILWGCNPSSTFASMQTPQYTTWSTQTYEQSPVMSVSPSYQFHTTSVYRSGMTDPDFTPLADNVRGGAPGHILRGNGTGWNWGDDDDPGDNPIGQIDDPAPIGEPLILLLLAALYGGYRLIKRKKVIS